MKKPLINEKTNPMERIVPLQVNLGSLPGSLLYQSFQISSWTSWHTRGPPLRLRCGVLCFSFMNWGMVPGIITQSSTQVTFAIWPLSISWVFITTLRWVITFSPYCMELWRRKLLELDSWVFRLSNQSEFGFPYLCVLVLSHVRLFCNPIDYSLPCPSVHGIFQASILEWFSISSSRQSFQHRDRTHVFFIAGRFFTTAPPGKTLSYLQRADNYPTLFLFALRDDIQRVFTKVPVIHSFNKSYLFYIYATDSSGHWYTESTFFLDEYVFFISLF